MGDQVSLKKEGGQAVLEYVLILSLALGAAVTLARGVREALDSGVLKLGAQLEKDLRTGRAPAHVFKN